MTNEDRTLRYTAYLKLRSAVNTFQNINVWMGLALAWLSEDMFPWTIRYIVMMDDEAVTDFVLQCWNEVITMERKVIIEDLKIPPFMKLMTYDI